MSKPLTKAQAKALALWRDGKARNEVALNVHATVYKNLRKAGYLQTFSFLQRKITPDGQFALAAYEAKHGAIT